jgi:F-type H+-transporting ATPase subunit b
LNMEIIKQFAEAAETTDTSIIGVLGIDWMMFVFQLAAFLILVWLLGKFVYPWLLKSIDDRQDRIEASAKAVAEAQAAASDTEKRVAKLLSEARTEADGIVATAKAESAATISAIEEKSKKRAEQITNDAKVQIDKEVLAAKKALHNEMIELVALATEKVVGKVVSKDIDNSLIIDAVKGTK